jgi:hypothetical protein
MLEHTISLLEYDETTTIMTKIYWPECYALHVLKDQEDYNKAVEINQSLNEFKMNYRESYDKEIQNLHEVLNVLIIYYLNGDT